MGREVEGAHPVLVAGQGADLGKLQERIGCSFHLSKGFRHLKWSHTRLVVPYKIGS